MTAPLSPAAQAVLDAYHTHAFLLNRDVTHKEILAVLLRAVADQVVPEQLAEPQGTGFRWGGWAAKQGVRRQLLAIAAELENTN